MGNPDTGKRLVQAYGCASCHIVDGLNVEPAHVGPPLDGFGARAYIAGYMPNTPENLVDWIMNPDSIKRGTAMPNLRVSEPEARHIAAYLLTLTDLPRSRLPFSVGNQQPAREQRMR